LFEILKICYKVGQFDPLMGNGKTDPDVRAGIVGHKMSAFLGQGERMVKVKFTLEQDTESQRGSKYISLLFP
jgi:hypothetical protein